ncbi:hypothetical protein GGI20_001843 [Coemansia sp. BCRC 34301]|nr:hypothetical protein GGI20_001843 [Coemansia sp. BCRC 34301]
MNLPPAERPLAATTPLPVDALPDEAPELESPNEEPLAHVEEPDEEPAGLTPPLPNEGKTAGTQRWRQQKQRQKPPIGNAVTYTATVDGLEGAPSRFTRSMARKIGGIQPPRRYFGEGVSESQILY